MSTLTKQQIETLAKGIRLEFLKEFYADPKNREGFEKWRKENGLANADEKGC